MQNCRHRWEPSEFGKGYWVPNTHLYVCHRCNAFSIVVLQSRQEEGERNAGALAKDLPGGATDATA